MILNDAIEQYRASRVARGYAKGTVRSDMTVCRYLMQSVGNIHVKNLSARHIDMLYSDHNWSPNTRNRVRIQLSTFFQWCRQRNYMAKDNDPIEGLRKLPVMQASRLFIPVQRFPELLDVAERRHPRDRMMVALGLYAFLRAGEVAALQWQDIDLDSLTIDLVRPKVQDRDRMPICDELAEELTRWRFTFQGITRTVVGRSHYVTPPLSRPGFTRGEDGRLVCSSPGVLVPDRMITVPHRPIQNALRDMGYDTSQEGGHTLRRSGGLALYKQLSNKGHDKAGRIVQAMYGHKTFATTEAYLRLDLERKERDDIVRGKQMFDLAEEGQVIQLGDAHGESGR